MTAPAVRRLVMVAALFVAALLGASLLTSTADAAPSGTAGVRSLSSLSAPMTAEGPRHELTASGGWVAASNVGYSGGAAVQNTTTSSGDPVSMDVGDEGGLFRLYGTTMTGARTLRWRIVPGLWTPVTYSAGVTSHQVALFSTTVEPGDVVQVERVSANSVTLDFWTVEPPEPEPTTTTTTTAPTTTTTEAPTTTDPTTTTTTAPESTTTTSPVQACFLAGQAGTDTPSSDSETCVVAWSSGRQTNAFLDHEAEQDEWFRKPILAGLALVTFMGSARVVSGWKRR